MSVRAAVMRGLLVAAVFAAAAFVSVAAPDRVGAAVVPVGFTDSSVGSVTGPTALAFTSDGRMLVTARAGQLYVGRNGTIAATPALDLSAVVCQNGERGLLGVAADPAFATNGFVYLYYTKETAAGTCPSTATPWPTNRVSRFVLGTNDVVVPGSEVVLFDGIPSVAGNHNAGDLVFGPDGMLYVSVGDSGCDYAAFANCAANNDATRDTNVALGKILRISPVDGSAPADNPFAGPQDPCRDDGFTTAGSFCPETFAWGFRNPFRMAFAPDGRLYVNDVGQSTWEEIDDVQAGRDYGWNQREGKCTTGSTTDCPPPPTGVSDPIFAYGRSDGCRSITGGAFAPDSWPEAYRGDYLFADYACGKIFRLEGTTRVDVVTGLGSNSAVHLQVGPDGALYYTTFAAGDEVRKLTPPGASTPGATYVSDLTPVSATNGSGPVERDKSNGGSAAGDGATITLQGVTASKGLGTHAVSNVVYSVAGASTFVADIGIDDECGAYGSVVFQVFVNGVKVYGSGVMTGTSATKSVSVPVAGASQVTLKVTNAGDGSACDHADWANARLRGATSPTTAPSTSVPTTVPPTTVPPTTVPPTTVPPTTVPPTTVPPTTVPPTTVPPPPPGTFVSDLTPVSATNGSGPFERDMSNGGSAAGDGRTITLNGVPAGKGLGTHAMASIRYTVPAGATAFRADVGVDDECGAYGSVVFQVFVDGVKVYGSGVMTGTSATKSVSVPVVGASQVMLNVTSAGDGSACDHADWANARFT